MLIERKEVMINDTARTIYYSTPSHNIIALFLVAKELTYRGGHCLTAPKRQKPYIK